MNTRLSLGKKLFLGFITTAIIGLIGNLIVIFGIDKFESQLRILEDEAILQLQYQTDLRLAVTEADLVFAQFKNPRLTSALYEKQFALQQKAEALAGNALQRFDKLQTSSEARAFYDALNTALKDLIRIDAAILQVAREYQGKPEASEKIAVVCDDLNRDEEVSKAVQCLEEMEAWIEKRIEAIIDDAYAEAQFILHTAIIAAIIVLIVSLCMSILFPRSISKMARSISDEIRKDADSVKLHTRELAAGSQALAMGANQQAASVQEIAASIEEVSSMVRHNADTAHEVDRLVSATKAAVETAQESMRRSLTANDEISRASGETAKIVKTIDEIAFQTNLLSLNAAVEAANAGDAGNGFAVVADEVRGLSMRSAEASKRTADLIDQTKTKIREGVSISRETGTSIDEVVNHVHKVTQLAAEVAAASSEQAKGLAQINVGVSEMEKVIQQNAAQSEQIASSTEALRSQAEEIMTSVERLDQYIFGNTSAGIAPV